MLTFQILFDDAWDESHPVVCFNKSMMVMKQGLASPSLATIKITSKN
jgi:hypothetical protein